MNWSLGHVVIFGLLIAIICFLQARLWITARHVSVWRGFAEDRTRQISELCLDVEKANKLIAELQDQPRIIALARKDRLNLLTVARGPNNDTFILETMGLLSDTPDKWAQLLGLEKVAPTMWFHTLQIIPPVPDPSDDYMTKRPNGCTCKTWNQAHSCDEACYL